MYLEIPLAPLTAVLEKYDEAIITTRLRDLC